MVSIKCIFKNAFNVVNKKYYIYRSFETQPYNNHPIFLNKKTNILFITWDSGDTNYLETLFLPIFSKIQKNSQYNFFCLQYTWANQETISQRKEKSEKSGIVYKAIPMKNTLLNKVSNIINSPKHIEDFCNQNDIH